MTIKVDDTLVLNRVRGVSDRAHDLTPAGRQLVDMLRDEEADLFNTRNKGRWAPLKASTRARKARAGMPLPNTPMVATGRLMTALVAAGKPPGAHRTITSDSVEFGTTLEYATHLAKGRRNMPKRRGVVTATQIRRKATRVVRDHIMGGR